MKPEYLRDSSFITRQRGGFTILEVVIVAIIIAILVSIGVPNYIDAVERTRAREALATVQSIAAGLRTYAAERKTYFSPANDLEWEILGVDNPNSNDRRSFHYTVEDEETTFTATGTRRSGPYADKTVIINQDGEISGTLLDDLPF